MSPAGAPNPQAAGRPLRALSVSQPWATLVAVGAKHAETRSWRPIGAGAPPWPLAIHAAKAFPSWARELCATEPFASVLAAAGYPDPAGLPRGAVVAVCTLLGVRPTAGDALVASALPDLDGTWVPAPHEHAFGDYRPGRWAWLLTQATPLVPAVPARGAQGLWRWVPGSASTPA